MTSVYSPVSANLMSELYFQMLQKMDLMEGLNQVPFQIQRRRNGFTPAVRLMSLLASQAQGCSRLTDWTAVQRRDSRLCHWMGDRPAPHPSTISRTLAAADKRTVQTLRQQVMVPLTDQVLLLSEAQRKRIFVDVDNKSLAAEGKKYEGTTYGRMADGKQKRGYRLHLISVGNRWALEMELTGANAHAVPSAMVMVKRLMHRVHGNLRRHMILRGDSNHGSVHFIRFLQRYNLGYLLKCYSPLTAERLWKENAGHPTQRIQRPGKVDLLAMDLGRTVIHGYTRKKTRQGEERRKSCQTTVDRVVVYREDPQQVPAGKEPECFALFATLPACEYDPGELLREAYLPRGGDIENIFNQLDQAFAITHLRSRRFHGNWTFLLLALIAATLTQLVREEAIGRTLPIPAGLKETLEAASQSGLRFEQDPQAGCVLIRDATTTYSDAFDKILWWTHQHRFKWAA